MNSSTNTPVANAFNTHQKRVLFLLALVQFCIILDFMIIAPIGDILMKAMSINTAQFGVVVSSYAFSAAIASIISAGFADRFDRKKLLVIFFSGFILGTIACGISKNYEQIVVSRIITGMFAGISNAVLMTLVIDLFLPQQRGRAMGVIQMGFGMSQVIGVPLGLFIAARLGWQFTFFGIVLLAVGIIAALIIFLDSANAHLQHQIEKNPFVHFWKTISNSDYQIGFSAVTLLSIGGFMIMPFTAVFLVNNVHVSIHDLPLVFLSSGIVALIVMPLMGKLSDKYDRFTLFAIGSVAGMVAIIIYTHLAVTPLWLVIIINMLVMACIMCRMSPAMALNSMVPKPEDRGAYMGLSSALQQTAGGLGAIIAGIIIYQADNHSPLVHFDWLGYIIALIFGTCIYLVYRMKKLLDSRTHH